MRRIVTAVMGAGLLVGLMMPTGLALEPTERLTLTEVSGWVPEAQLDTEQVEAPVETPAMSDFGSTLGEGWEPFEADEYPHPDCYINVGDTSVIVCADGHTEIS